VIEMTLTHESVTLYCVVWFPSWFKTYSVIEMTSTHTNLLVIVERCVMVLNGSSFVA
jgi:hypothetical protein